VLGMSAIALDPLIAEAKQRARRRRWWLAAAAALALAAGIGVAFARGTRGTNPFSMQRPGSLSRVTGSVSAASALSRRGIGAVGSSGGVTWAANSRGIWLTTNGGRSWSSVPHDLAAAGLWEGPHYVRIQFVDKRHGWIDGRTEIDRTTDGGQTWQRSVPPGCAGRCGGAGISFLDTEHGFAFEGTRQANMLFRTSDGGRTWQLVSKPSIWGPIQFVNARDGFAGGKGQMMIGNYQGPPIVTLFRTRDGGRTWSKYDIAGSDSFAELPIGVFGGKVVLAQNAPNPKDGLNLNPGAVWVSGDAGAHWLGRPVPFPAGSGARSFTTASPDVWGFAVGHDLYVTADGGARWRHVALRGLPRFGWIGQIVFTSSRIGWAVMPVGRPSRTLFRTTDGGKHWTPAGPPKPKARKHG